MTTEETIAFLYEVSKIFDLNDGDFYFKEDTEGDKPLNAEEVVKEINKIYDSEPKRI